MATFVPSPRCGYVSSRCALLARHSVIIALIVLQLVLYNARADVHGYYVSQGETKFSGETLMVDAESSPIEIHVNGRPHIVQATAETPLLYVLRNELGLNAAKPGCALEQCGVCTVLHGGSPIRSCVTPVRDVTEAEITTLEGLGTPDTLHPVQQAFLDEQAAQCGYCIPGMMMSASALLDENPHPTEDEIREALQGNLCRCGAHVRILKAVQRAAANRG